MATLAKRPVNHWPDSKCAKAFWTQHEIPPYRDLLEATKSWMTPDDGEHWLDLGCGCGQLTEALWEKSEGRVASITGVDVADVNAQAFERLRSRVRPACGDRIRFQTHDLSLGLAPWRDGSIDGIVSGLAIQYAECYSDQEERWTTTAYDHLLSEMCRVLRPHGKVVFSVNVPEPAWWKVAARSLHGTMASPKPGRYLKNAWRMMRYGRWLSREARVGRFHYLPMPTHISKLRAAGFMTIESRISYAGQAFVFRCGKK